MWGNPGERGQGCERTWELTARALSFCSNSSRRAVKLTRAGGGGATPKPLALSLFASSTVPHHKKPDQLSTCSARAPQRTTVLEQCRFISNCNLQKVVECQPEPLEP